MFKQCYKIIKYIMLLQPCLQIIGVLITNIEQYFKKWYHPGCFSISFQMQTNTYHVSIVHIIAKLGKWV